MVLDGEKDESLRVLLEEGLVGLLGPEARGGSGLLDLLDLGDDGLDLLDGSDVGVVLLISDVEVELLDGGLHLEGLDSSGSLC